jgi:hypothetical protein
MSEGSVQYDDMVVATRRVRLFANVMGRGDNWL